MTQSFIIESAALRSGVSAVRSVVQAVKAIPILNNLRMDAADGKVRLLATNQDCWSEITLPAAVNEPFATTVSAALLGDIAARAPEGSQIELSITESGAAAKAGRARWRLPTLPVEKFPPMNSHGIEPAVRMKLSDMLFAIAAVEHVKAGDHKPHLQGMLVRRIDKGIECAAFDGNRLSYCAVPAQVSPDFEMITIPTEVIKKIRTAIEGAADEVTIGHNGRLALIECGPARFLTRLVEGKFTPYWTAMPELVGEPVLFEPKEMIDAMGRVALAQDQYSTGVRIDLEADKFTMSLASQTAGDATDTVIVGYSGEQMRLGFSLQYLRDAVAKCPGDEAEMRLDALGNAHIFARSPEAPRHMMCPMKV
ncbi:DNA polymerase III subunit beta [Sphingobium sp. CFD-2]|uniref:DNA polymerase III subunit beta n=1 Tax=Sphingobium sp. CFD-2 TaxID=2878542 RepID=UPI00214BA5AA|nr:DNA polymerase III subunit beta [Sphingobium sp. CFD-2]